MTGSHTDRIVCFDSVERSPAEGHVYHASVSGDLVVKSASHRVLLKTSSCFETLMDASYSSLIGHTTLTQPSCCFLGPIPIKACFRDTDAQALRHMVREPLALSMPRGGTVDQLAHFGKFKSKLRTIWGRVHSDGLHSSLGDPPRQLAHFKVASRDATPTLCTDPESST
ncbi:hypothetical protein SNK03_13585 [Fusarium graminearum]